MDNFLDPSILQDNMECPCPLVETLSRYLLCLEEAKATVPLEDPDQRAPRLAAHMGNNSQDMERQVQVPVPMLLVTLVLTLGPASPCPGWCCPCELPEVGPVGLGPPEEPWLWLPPDTEGIWTVFPPVDMDIPSCMN